MRRGRDPLHLQISDQLDLSIRVLPWLALNVAGDAFAAYGLDGTSFFYGQAVYLINARAGALVRVYRSRTTGTQPIRAPLHMER